MYITDVRALRPKAPPLRYHSARFGRIAHWMYGSEVPVASEETSFSARQSMKLRAKVYASWK